MEDTGGVPCSLRCVPTPPLHPAMTTRSVPCCDNNSALWPPKHATAARATSTAKTHGAAAWQGPASSRYGSPDRLRWVVGLQPGTQGRHWLLSHSRAVPVCFAACCNCAWRVASVKQDYICKPPLAARCAHRVSAPVLHAKSRHQTRETCTAHR